MIARLALLPDGVRRGLALATVAAGVALPVLLIGVLALSLLQREARRAELVSEVGRLHAAMQQRLDAQGPAGPAPARSMEAAETLLMETAAGIAARLDGAPVSVAIAAPQPARIGAVQEMRLEVTLAGAPDALAAALARIDAGAARTFLVDLSAPQTGLAEARIVFVMTSAEPAP